jgi:microsomal dipeptidase-like Zn-dependent dipeptidase
MRLPLLVLIALGSLSLAAQPKLPPPNAPGRIQLPSSATTLDPNTAAMRAANWDFEGGLTGWTATGNAFANQPTYGDNVITVRVNQRLVPLGGDYWKGPYPIGIQGQYWIGTYENRRTPDARWGVTQGDGPTGTLTSQPFPIRGGHLSFLIGGGNDATRTYVELITTVADYDRIAAARAGTRLDGGGKDGKDSQIAIHSRDGETVVLLRATGQNSEVLRRVSWDLTRFAGITVRIRIVDNSSGGWGHINADDFRLTEQRLETPAHLWGFADTHAHPANYLGFGGNMVQGKLYSTDGNPATALPPVFVDVPATQSLVAFFSAISMSDERGGGHPDYDNYPKFDNTIGQQMYSDWIHRAYKGGLRLMSALAINNWMLASHSLKNALFGGSQPQDDKASADVQIADIKKWAAMPENKTWVEVAYTPKDARRIIGENKLALVLGVELDLLGNFAPNRTWASPEIRVLPPNPAPYEEDDVRATLGAELDRLYAMGVRQITPLHYVSGVFGGTALFNRLFNEVNRSFTGQNLVVESGDRYGVRYRVNNDAWGTGAATARELATGHSRTVASHESWERVPLGHVNSMGLTRTGHILFEEAARRGMLIDIDHASFKTTDHLLAKAESMKYPVLSSHSDFLDLGMTGRGEFTHNDISNDDLQNFANFRTTVHGNLRHEGMGTREKFERIAKLGGTLAPLTSTYRRKAYGDSVKNDNEGSSKTWAQMYQYALEVSGGKGLALASDRGFINFLSPRFGPNSAFMLSEEEIDELRVRVRGMQVEAQENGVRYASPIKNWRASRFKSSGSSAYDYTGKAFEHEDAWLAIAAFKTGRNPWTLGEAAQIPRSGAIGQTGRIENFARGFFATREEQLNSECGIVCAGATIPERYSAWFVKNNIDPATIPRWANDEPVMEHYRWVKKAWDHWHRMEGNNEPLERYVIGERDFDVNIDGVAHYGMLPDLLQDVKNVGLTVEQLAPLFRSAEDYVRMWETCASHRSQR